MDLTPSNYPPKPPPHSPLPPLPPPTSATDFSFLLGKLKKKQKNIWMDLVHNGGGGVSGRVHFSRVFFYF